MAIFLQFGSFNLQIFSELLKMKFCLQFVQISSLLLLRQIESEHIPLPKVKPWIAQEMQLPFWGLYSLQSFDTLEHFLSSG
jgi:hypothetical protein